MISITIALAALQLGGTQVEPPLPVSKCPSHLGPKLEWTRVEDHPRNEYPDDVAQTIDAMEKGYDGLLEVSFVHNNKDKLDSYVFLARILLNNHPGYRWDSDVHFSCNISSAVPVCENFSFFRSDTINFPQEVDPYYTDGHFYLVARGLSQKTVAPSTDRYVLDGDAIKKCL